MPLPTTAAVDPVHCPARSDGWQLLSAREIEGCDARHPAMTAAVSNCLEWIQAVSHALITSTLLDLRVPHPDPGSGTINCSGLDPDSAHLFVAGARHGVNVANALYVGLVCQAATTGWHGVAGMYVPLCDCEPESVGWPTLRQLTRGLPTGTQAVDQFQLPAGLAPQPHWWDDRLMAVYRLQQREESLWALSCLDELPAEQACLIRTGPRISAEPNLLYLRSGAEVRPLLPLLQERHPHGSVRLGSAAELRRCAGADGSGVPPRRLDLSLRSRRIPTGWAVVRWNPDGVPVLTRSVRNELRRPSNHGATELSVWTAPRLSAGGVIDGTGLIALLAAPRAR